MRRIAIVVVGVVLSSLAFVPGAFAQTGGYIYPGAVPFSETAMTTIATREQSVNTGSSISEAVALDGSVSGSPLNGSFHVDENLAWPIDGAPGSVQGQFSLQDGSGNAIYGDLSGPYIPETASSPNAEFTIRGGNGVFAGATGSGEFQEGVSTQTGNEELVWNASTFGMSPAPEEVLSYPSVESYPVVESYPSVQSYPVAQPEIVVVPQVVPQQRDGDHNRDDHRGDDNHGHDGWGDSHQWHPNPTPTPTTTTSPATTTTTNNPHHDPHGPQGHHDPHDQNGR